MSRQRCRDRQSQDPITEQKQEAAELEKRLGFETLLVDLSATLATIAPDQLDGEIQRALCKVVEFLGNERSSLGEFTEDGRDLMVVQSYAVPGCDPYLAADFASHAPWYVDQLRGGKAVAMRRLPDDLPHEAVKEREYCVASGVKSHLGIPLRVGGSVVGLFALESFKEYWDWSEKLVSGLRLLGEIFANALVHRRAALRLQKMTEEVQQLKQRLEQENLRLREQIKLSHRHGRIIGQSDAMRKVLALAEQVAPTGSTVLITGETGTGKELLACEIHELSPRRDRPMVIVNCAALPPALIESELFGREAGAYTGALSKQIGRFEMANGSTLLLDEIGELPLELQAKLLRAIQDGRFERVGSPESIKVDVRIIAASNRDLPQMVADGKFRRDLYHRLNVFPIHIPPLRQRREDIPPLVWAYVEEFGKKMGKSIDNIPRVMMEALKGYSWAGNVRELSNLIERSLILATGPTLYVDLPDRTCPASPCDMTLAQLERRHILHTLERTGWRVRGPHGAAQLLGLKPTTLEARMGKLGIRRRGSDRSNIS